MPNLLELVILVVTSEKGGQELVLQINSEPVIREELPMDTTTLFLIIIILVAIVLIAVGIYLILVLHEARITFRRLNNILDHADSIIEILDEKIAQPAGSLFGVLGIANEVMEVLQKFRKNWGKERTDGQSQQR